MAKKLFGERYINVATKKHHTSNEFQLIKENKHLVEGAFKWNICVYWTQNILKDSSKYYKNYLCF
ncbi:hypothetical protein [Methanobacterium formicicum]|uniref:hypothetical protein n=1 Tax=Methanobacterium formicicum TaxID=2162 RepID=UPI00178C6E55|nr:hypothetical protein [Methanobacterium formicicum]